MSKLNRAASVFSVLAIVGWAFADDPIILVNNGSTANINPYNHGVGGNGYFGFRDWRMTPGGENFVRQKHYFLRTDQVGSAGLVAYLSVPVIDQPTPDLATVTYRNEALSHTIEISIRYLLTGAGPSSSTMSEVVTIKNIGSAAKVYQLYDYNEFTPGGVDGGTGTLLNSSTIRQENAQGFVTVGATVIPDRWMIGPFSQMSQGLSSGNFTNSGSPYSTTDPLLFGFQWDVTLQPGEQWQMGNTSIIESSPVPEPSSLLVLGGLGALAVGRRRSRGNTRVSAAT